MSDAMILLSPLLVILILAAFRFTGCSSFGTGYAPPPETKPVADPPVPAPPVKAPTYESVVTGTAGFAALWPLNETGGTVASVVGPLSPGANGLYRAVGVPIGTGYKLGQNGLRFAKDTTDFAPSFDGTAGHVEVQFTGPLNPDKSVPGFTVELWAKPNPGVGGATQVLISSHRFDAAGSQQGYEIALVKVAGQPNQQIRGRVFANGTMTETTAQPLLEDPAEWRHIVLVYDKGAAVARTVSLVVRIAKTANSYKDGPHSAAYEGVTMAKPSTMRFAAGHATGQTPVTFFAGQIDNVAFYNAALTQTDLDKHFAMF